MNNWVLNRVGLLNFWYYQNQIFEFANGHMLLRGTNGSGKSLTMQSLFPVLFDGDTSAYRLDSFGSRDRKMEDYLLGEKGVSNRDDGTGYLFLEVKRRNREEYLTIGIGLSVSDRGNRLNKWFFALENNQRIGIDIELFEMIRVDEMQPFSKKKLKNRLEGKGRVFESQKEYKEYVNATIFGFETMEQFDELIALLINLRSPKLSKEYRPSVIYGILRDSLPKLKEDELLSLSRTIEQLDGHRERLEDLQNETRELAKFSRVYQELQQELTGQVASHWYELYRKKESLFTTQTELRSMIAEVQQSLVETQKKMADNDLRLQVLEKSISELSQHEGFHLVARGQELKEQGIQLARLVKEKQKQLQQKQQAVLREKQQLETYLLADEQLIKELDEVLADNEQYLDVLSVHSLNQQYSQKLKEQPQEEDYRYWRSEILKKQTHYGNVIQELKEMAHLTEENRTLSRTIGEKQQSIDELLRDIRQWEQLRISEIEKWKSAVDQWRGELPFVIDELGYQQFLYQVDQLAEEELPEHVIMEPIQKSYQHAIFEKRGQRIPLENRQTELAALDHQIREEMEQWKHTKIPEPKRSAERSANRQTLAQPYICFYQAVDFQKNIDTKVCNSIEGALLASGILDSLIGKEGLQVDDDVQILPAPQFFTSTLADILTITPDTPQELQGVVADVLQSIVLDDVQDGVPMIAKNGTYQLANLRGAAAKDYQASYIGATNQERYRQHQLALLERQLQEIEEEQQQLENQLVKLQAEEQHMMVAFEQHPTGSEVYQAIAYLQKKTFEKEEETASLEKRKQQAEALQAEITDLQVQIHAHTQQDQIQLNLTSYEEAVRYSQNYAANVQDIYHYAKDSQNKKALIQKTQEYIDQQEEDTLDLTQELMEFTQDQAQNTSLLQENLAQQQLVNVEELQQRLSQSKDEQHQRRQAQDQLGQTQLRLTGEESSYTTKLAALEAQQATLENQESHWQQLLHIRTGLPLEELAAFAKVEKREPNSKRAKELESKVISQFNYLADQLQSYQPQLLNQTGIEINNQDEQAISEFGAFNHYKEASFQFEGQKLHVMDLLTQLNEQQLTLKELLKKDDEQLFKRVILESVGTILRKKIEMAMTWVQQMNQLLLDQENSSGLTLSIKWKPLTSMSEQDLGTVRLVALLQKQTELLTEADREAIARHFQEKVHYAQEQVQKNPDERNTLFQAIAQVLDYRDWFAFELRYKRANEGYQTQVLTDRKFNQFSGGEKAVAMYLPLFTAVASRYRDARKEDCPKVITLDEAFAGIDDKNIGELFKACEQLDFNYVMNSQALFGDYPTVSSLMVYELLRPQNMNLVTAICYYWNGHRKEMRVGELSHASK